VLEVGVADKDMKLLKVRGEQMAPQQADLLDRAPTPNLRVSLALHVVLLVTIADDPADVVIDRLASCSRVMVLPLDDTPPGAGSARPAHPHFPSRRAWS